MRMLRELGTEPLPMVALSMAAFPVLVILALLGYAIEAWAFLGHWPSYANPDPKQLGWWVQHSALQLAFMGFPVASILAICMAVFGRKRSRDFPFWAVIVTAVVSTALLVTYCRTDPGGLLNWFWD